MNIKKIICPLVMALFFTTAFTNCSDWTDVKAENKAQYGNTETARSESYYKALREYKQSKHSISFGWYSGWGDKGAQTANMMSGLPDSLDLISLWGNWVNPSPSKLEDLRFIQKTKGTKVMLCTFIQHIGKGFTQRSTILTRRPAKHSGVG